MENKKCQGVLESGTAPAEEDSYPRTMDRREFLRGTVWAAAAGLGLSSMGPASAILTPPQREIPPFSVGYWPGREAALSDTLADGTHLPFRPDVTAASALTRGEAALAEQGVQVTVHGFFPAAPHRSISPLSLNAFFPVGQGTSRQTLPFHAWSRDPAPTPSESRPVSFVMPVDREDGLLFSLVRSDDGDDTEIYYRFIPGPGSDAKLRRGVYFLAITEAPNRFQPRWGSYQFRPASAEEAPTIRKLYRRSGNGIVPVEFDYLVLSIEDKAGSGAAV